MSISGIIGKYSGSFQVKKKKMEVESFGGRDVLFFIHVTVKTKSNLSS